MYSQSAGHRSLLELLNSSVAAAKVATTSGEQTDEAGCDPGGPSLVGPETDQRLWILF